MAITFTKMHGLGNDFVIIDMRAGQFELRTDHISHMSDRHMGIGFDQLFVLASGEHVNADIYCAIYNADGSKSGQCGNGMRCVAQYVFDHGGFEGNALRICTDETLVDVYRAGDHQWRVNMGLPLFDRTRIPILSQDAGPLHRLKVADSEIEVFAVNFGNPHAVIDNSRYKLDVSELGPTLESHTAFPQRANIGFVEVQSRKHVRLRVYERGAGETLACGSGACAAAVAAIYQDWCDEDLCITLPGGDLQLQWEKGDNPVWMTGPTSYAYRGEIELGA